MPIVILNSFIIPQIAAEGNDSDKASHFHNKKEILNISFEHVIFILIFLSEYRAAQFG